MRWKGGAKSSVKKTNEQGKLMKLKSVSALKGIDIQFLVAVYILLTFGLLMVLSASSPVAYAGESTNYDSLYFFKKQLRWALVGSLGMFVAATYDYHRLKRIAFPAFLVGLVLLGAVLIPAISMEVKGARRWIDLKVFSFQPSEIVKFAVILFMAFSLSKNYKELKNFSVFLLYIGLLGIVAGLIMLEPHFSCTMLIVLTAVIMMFAAGAKISHFVILGVAGLPVIAAAIIMAPYRMARVTTFLDPFKDIQGSGWQIVQSLYAIGSGGIFGAGIGQSRQKFFNIPEPHNDFIFSILAEEFGLLGAVLVSLMFIFLIARGVKIALKAPDLFGALLTTGIITMVAIQAMVNIAVVTSSMPVTGMPLPFFSYGGTALAITMTEMGIILNVSRHCNM